MSFSRRQRDRGYIRAQLTACVLIGVIAHLASLLGLPGGLVMGLIAGVL